ncbi:MAG TPA: FecR domain-containing protein [Pyrinomonadaceae bacterium]|jgi:hypothetical protein
MKNAKNLSLGIVLALLFVSTSAAVVARADDGDDVDNIRDARIISARAGRVNFVAGDVRLRRSGSQDWRALAADDELKSGDAVSTGAVGRVEILLNPGSYFRAGAGAEFTLAEADLDDLRVELARGSAVVEATGYGDTELSIRVATARTTVHIIRSGVYRFNALPDGAAEVSVFSGRARVGETLVKGGKAARPGAGGVEVSKFDKKNRDELDLWSRDRGKELAKANEKLQRRSLSMLLARNSFDSLFGAYGRGSGFWFYNGRMSCYTFVPFSSYWRSPYGYSYGTGVIPYGYAGGYRPARPGYTPPSTAGGVTGQRPSSGAPDGGPGRTGGMPPAAPPRGDGPTRSPSPSPRMERSPSPSIRLSRDQ